MDLGLNGKRVLITGATGGLGGGIARAFVAEGASVIIHGRSYERAHALANELSGAGAAVTIALGDLGNAAGVAQVLEQVAANGERVDVLVNNAGGDGELTKTWLDITPEEWGDMYEADVIGSVRLIRALVPRMFENEWGRLLQMSAGAAVRPFPIGAHYSGSKAALSNLSVSLAQAVGGRGVTSNAIVCGPIHTPGIEAIWTKMAPSHSWGETWPEIEANAVRQFTPNPLGRLGRIEELAAAAVFLCGISASFINGATLRVDGGALGVV